MKYDFIEIGTSDFDTLIQSTVGEVGLSIDPLQLYLDKLPDNPHVIKVNAALSDVIGNCDVFWVDPNHITEYNLSWYLKGCNTINKPHPVTLKELKEKNLEHLMNRKEVNVIDWKTLVRMYDIKSVDLLKLDCEGHDCVIINNILQLNTILPKKIWFEANGLTPKETINDTIEKLIKLHYNIIKNDGWDVIAERIQTK